MSLPLLRSPFGDLTPLSSTPPHACSPIKEEGVSCFLIPLGSPVLQQGWGRQSQALSPVPCNSHLVEGSAPQQVFQPQQPSVLLTVSQWYQLSQWRPPGLLATTSTPPGFLLQPPGACGLWPLPGVEVRCSIAAPRSKSVGGGPFAR